MAEVLDLPATDVAKPKKKSGSNVSTIDWVMAASLKAKGFEYPAIAAQLGCNEATLRSGMSRKGLTTVVRAVKQGNVGNEAEKLREIIQGSLAVELQAQIGALSGKPVKYSDLATKDGKQGRAAVVKTVAETYRAVYGAADSVTIQFGVSMLAADQELGRSAIDVQASVTQDPSPSVPDTTAGGVLPQNLDTSKYTTG